MARPIGYVVYALRWLAWQAGRAIRRLRGSPKWVLFLIEEAYPELPPPPRPRWQRLLGGRRSLSQRDLRDRCLQVAADSRTAGIILHLRPLDLPLAQVQGYRDLIAELRSKGKRVIAFAPTYTTSTYHVASACDEVLLMRGGTLNALGYARTYMFLADALQQFGLQADVVQITPYKTALDFISRNSMSDQAREMATWLADAAFSELLADLGSGRRLDAEQTRALVAATPATDEEAMALKAVDGVLYEEELAARLGGRIMGWREARRRLPRAAPSRPGRHIGLLRIEGTIVDGRSARPPAGPLRVPLLLQARSGDLTIVQQARRLADDPQVAAVVLWIDSGGGSSTASEAMSSALSALAKRKPMVAAMGSVAASGGYHVATSARRVFAQPGTITGSIGVLAGKLTLGGLFDRLLVQREQVVRGEHAAMFAVDASFTEEERARLKGLIDHTYEQFLERVAGARGLPRDGLEAIAGGRVWTGRQALERGLVDELGGVEQAIAHARALGGLSESAPLREARSGTDVAPASDGTATPIGYALEAANTLNRTSTWLLCPLVFWP